MKLKITTSLLALFCCLQLPNVAVSRISITASLTHERPAKMGETYQGVISIKNPSTSPVEVKLYQTDYQFLFDGSNSYGEPGKLKRSNANWINFSPDRLVIPPNGTAGVNYTVTVPDDGSLVGTYWSMLMVEEISQDSPESSKPEPTEIQLGVRQIWRLGVQLVTHIRNTGTRDLKFVSTNLLREKAKTILQVDIENIGERWLKPSLWLELYAVDGGYVERFEAKKVRVYPGTSVRIRFDLSKVPKGTYKALLAADCGGDDVFGINYTLKFDE